MSFQLPSVGTQPIFGGGDRPIGSISCDGRIQIGDFSARIDIGGRVMQGDREVGRIGLKGLELGCLGRYQSIQSFGERDYRVR